MNKVVGGKEACPLRSSGLLRGTALLTATGICSQVLGFFYRIALSRLISAENMGLFQLIMPVFSLLLSATAVGLTAAVSTLSAHRLALGDRAGARALVNHCVSWFLLLGGGAGILLALASDPVSVLLLGDARTQLGLILLVPCFLLTGVENIQKHFFYGTGNVKAPALIELCEQCIRTAAVLGLLTAFLPQNPERTVGLIVCGMVVCEVFSAAVLTLFFGRFMAGVPHRREPGLLKTVGAVALPVGGTALLNNLLGSVDSILIPQLLVAGGMGVSQAMSQFGILFGMTAPLLSLPTAFIGAMGLVLMPDLAERIALGKRDEARQTVENCLRAASLLLFPALAFLTAVGPELGTFLFKEAAVGQFLVPLALGTALNCRQSVLSCALNGVGRQADSARTALIADAVQLLFTIVTVKDFGMAGYVAGYLVSSVLGVWLNRRAAKKALGLGGGFFLQWTAPGLAALLMGLCIHLLFHILLDWGLSLFPAVGACAAFGLVLYLAALSAMGSRSKNGKRR